MRRLERLLILFAALRGLLRRERPAEPEPPIVPAGGPDRRAERVVLALLGLCALSAVAFVVLYAIDGLAHRTQWLGVALALALGCAGVALVIVGKRLVVTEELEEPYPQPAPGEQAQVAGIVHQSASRLTRKRLLLAAGGTAGSALALAALTPVLSAGPILDTDRLRRTPWRRGRRLVQADGTPLAAADIADGSFYTAYPQGADRDQVGSPLVVVRLDPASLRLPPGRRGWAPQGILAYSKVCTHAGCAIALYRKPLFPPVQPRPALVCPCHYSTFDPARGGTVIFGPAGRPLPQLPLLVDPAGDLRAAGPFSGPVGPSWGGVRRGRAGG
jgi:ubiquinol-cytochrome c reductase iron-sulfur subunit